MNHFKKYILLYTILPLFILTVMATYYRIIVLQDYLVSYQLPCDLATHSCYFDSETNGSFYFVERRAVQLSVLCGNNSVLDCAAAAECTSGEGSCIVQFCQPDSGHSCYSPSGNLTL